MTDKNLEDKIDNLDYSVEKSIRYHQRRRNFFDWVNRLSMFALIICGSATFAKYLGFVEYYAAAITIIAAFNLVWAPSHKSRDHEILFKRFSNLAVQIRTTQASEKAYGEWLKERINIETEEPPIYNALEADCDNEVRRAWGRDEKIISRS